LIKPHELKPIYRLGESALKRLALNLRLALPLLTVLLAGICLATPPGVTPSDLSSDQSTSGNGTGFVEGVARSSYLLGDMGGIRPLLSKYGVSLNITETSEGLGNITGGAKRGFEYDGLTQMVLQVDTQRAFGLHGGTFNVSGLQLHGRNLSTDNLYTLQTASGIESDRSTRLWELWYQQKFLDEDRLDIKVGQQSLDQEFMVSQNALVFVNTMFGWPMVPSADLPGGGPAYPLSAPGVRVRAHPTDSLTVLVGAFNGSPVNNMTGDPQQRNQSGLTFPVDGGLLAVAEVQYQYPSLGTMVYADDSSAMSGTYRLGVWYDTESFADQRFSNVTHRGDMGIYAVVDEMLWHSEEDPDHALSVFCRAMGTPQSDRNLIDFSLNVGTTLHDPIPHRDDDTLGIGLGYAHVSGSAADADRDTRATIGAFYPIRTDETFVEVTYQYQLFPWCQIQPDFQYVFNPGAGILNPNAPTQRIGDEAVLGVRFNIIF
jgi:porin